MVKSDGTSKENSYVDDFVRRIQNVQEKNTATRVTRVPNDRTTPPRNPAAAAAPVLSIFLLSTNASSVPLDRHVTPRGPATPPMAKAKITHTA